MPNRSLPRPKILDKKMAQPAPHFLTGTELLTRASAGDELAARLLYERYVARLIALVRVRLARRLARRVDPEDVVLSAWRSFFVGARAGRWSAAESDDLWPLLVTITLRKLSHQAQHHQAQRRATGREVDGELPLEMGALADDPTPAQAAALLDEVEFLHAKLSSTEQRILSSKLQGAESEQIARDCGCSTRTVRRTLQHVKEQLQQRDFGGEQPGSWTLARLATLVGERAALWRQHHVSEPTGPSPLPMPAIPFADLRLERWVGEGTFGKVYQAHERTSNGRVAVKFLKKSYWHDARAVDSLLGELPLIATIHHPAIIQIRGWGRTPAGGPFLVMEWIEGPTLEAWARGVRPSAQAIAAAVVQIARGVAVLHAAGILHGDLTPRNVLCSLDGRLVITDFGLSIRLGTSQPFRGGTLGFLAPEQVSDAFGLPSVRTDVYALGGLLYALLAQRPPFSAQEAAEALAAVLSAQPARRPTETQDNCDSLWKIALHCLQKEPADRPGSALEVAEMLAQLQKRA
jgi:DNA-directed RNA polymerase specialized sigma24 family protein/predicted Ser/Thr protein kinase